MVGGISLLITLGFSWLFYDAYLPMLSFPIVLLICSRIYQGAQREKRTLQLSLAFREMLQLLSDFLQAGASLERAFLQVEEQMRLLDASSSDFFSSIHRMNARVGLNEPLERAYRSMAEELALDEMQLFGEVLSFSKRLGGNYIRTIQKTAEQLSDKMILASEIDAMMAQKKLEMKVMVVIPLVILCYVRLTSYEMLSVLYHNAAGVLIMSGCLGVYVAMLFWGRRVMKIEI